MPKDHKYSRRAFIQKHLAAGMALFTGFWVLGSCQSARPAAQSQAPAAGQAPEPVAQTNPQPAARPAPQAGAGAGAPAAADPCDDLTGISPGEIDKRKKLAYVNKSPLADSRCGNCGLYVPPADGKPCGGCMLFKGPVQAGGYCTYWAPIN
jgi:hypothetical protein